MLSIFCALVVLAVLVDSARLRRRAGRLPRLSTNVDPPANSFNVINGPGVNLDEGTRISASEYALKKGLTVLDLWPAGLPPDLLLGLLQLVDVDRFRGQRLGRMITAGHAFVVDADVLSRAQVPVDSTPLDPVSFFELGIELKRFACTQTDVVFAPDCTAVPLPKDQRRALARTAMGTAMPTLYAIRAAWLLTLVTLALTVPIAGPAALVAWMLKPVLSLAGTGLRARGLFVYAGLRPLFELWDFVVVIKGRWRPDRPTEAEQVEAMRPIYAALLAEGQAAFFQERRLDCPICKARSLRTTVETGDLFQFKPGRFSVDECGDCGHVFQNPQLTPQGLSFYYRDFYDGLDAEALEALLGSTPQVYEARARMVIGHGDPSAWLDVGGGNGHLCCVSRDVWPKTRFDGLDLSSGMELAARRGWVDRAYNGLFPDLAPTLTAEYDVVSMSHYLEHTMDPIREIQAASNALRADGLLLIEVPDPESCFRKLLGRFWLPTFQPQHLHLLPVKALERLLRASGFEPLVWHRGETHYPLDLFLASSLFLNLIVPKPPRPWLPPKGPLAPLIHRVGWAIGMPILLVALTVDVLLSPFMRRPGLSNTYRVLARKVASP